MKKLYRIIAGLALGMVLAFTAAGAADITFGAAGGSTKKLKDMGDGTHAEVIYSGGAVTASSPGSVATGQVTVTTTATLIAAARVGRASVKITDLGTTDLFCGAAGVTTTTGDLLAGVKGAALTIATSAAVYCVVGTGTQAVSFMEVF